MTKKLLLAILFLKADISLCSNFGFGQGTSAVVVHFFLFKLEYGKLFSLHRCHNAYLLCFELLWD